MERTDLVIKMMQDRWQGALRYFDNILNALPDETIGREVVPGKLNILITRSTHLTYHTGQLALLQ